MPTFTHALAEQPESGFWLFGPEIFRTYCGRHGVCADTASAISVDHAKSLARELREAGTMVLRPDTGHGTYSFDFTVSTEHPHPLDHVAGQVEIDSVCIGVRDGRNHVIVTTRSADPAALRGRGRTPRHVQAPKRLNMKEPENRVFVFRADSRPGRPMNQLPTVSNAAP